MTVPKRAVCWFLFAVSIVVLGAMAVGPGQAGQVGVGAGVLTPRAPDQIRMMTWNVGGDSVFPPGAGSDSVVEGRPGQFARVLRAVRPDVLCLQEVTRAPKEVVALVASILPGAVGQAWHAHTVLDNAIVSRFPLTSQA